MYSLVSYWWRRLEVPCVFCPQLYVCYPSWSFCPLELLLWHFFLEIFCDCRRLFCARGNFKKRRNNESQNSAQFGSAENRNVMQGIFFPSSDFATKIYEHHVLAPRILYCFNLLTFCCQSIFKVLLQASCDGRWPMYSKSRLTNQPACCDHVI